MQFRIADTFTDSLAKLRRDEQKAVKTTTFDLQVDPKGSGTRFHRLDKVRDPNFWSARVNDDIRIIVHKTGADLLLCYVDHHDKAYAWAERRKLETHPKTGAAQLVEIRETVKEVVVAKYVEEEKPKPKLFAKKTDDELLDFGVPLEWIGDVKTATEDTLFELADHLPQEAAEALLDLATGGKPKPPARVDGKGDPFEHPDAKRRFRVMADVEELERALEYPWEKWLVFLHPGQRNLVESPFKGPARVSGSAGTGKTIVALHRAVSLAKRDKKGKVLLTTFSDTLANALRHKLTHLIGNEPSVFDRIDVQAIGTVGRLLYTELFGEPKLVEENRLHEMLAEAADEEGAHRYTEQFLWGEWNDVADAWPIDSWDAYRKVPRLGRKTRLGESQRRILWSIFERVRARLDDEGLVTMAGVFGRVTEHFQAKKKRPYDYAIVDEAQDIGVPELKFLATLAKGKGDALFFTGDLGQRIFQPPFSWKSLGVDIRGRSNTLHINYRTSHQIRSQADQLLPKELSDVDGVTENRQGTISAFNGPAPTVVIYTTQEKETNAVAEWLKRRLDEGVHPEEIGLFARSEAEIPRVRKAVKAAGLKSTELSESVQTEAGKVSILTMHLAKGLEFRAVAVMACDDEVIPSQERIEAISDEADLEEVYNTERHLLYVACTRARDHLLVTGVDPASEFLDDLLEV